MDDQIDDRLCCLGLDLLLRDVSGVGSIKYKVPRFMSKHHCIKYGLSPALEAEFWILPIKTACGDNQYYYFTDTTTAEIARSTLINALERYHTQCSNKLEKMLDSE